MLALEQITYEIALRALAQQERLMDDLRARTGTLLTAASLIGSFLGAQSIHRHGLSVWVAAAFVAFAVTMLLSVYVLLPKDGLTFSLDGPVAYEALYEVRSDEDEVQRRLTYWVQEFRVENQGTLDRMIKAIRMAAGALILELALLGLGLAVK